MNTGQVVAWLTCLCLAFLACILAVRSTGTALMVKQELADVKERVEMSSGAPRKEVVEQTRRALQVLGDVQAELQAIRKADIPDPPPKLQAKLDAIEKTLAELEKELRAAAGEGKR